MKSILALVVLIACLQYFESANLDAVASREKRDVYNEDDDDKMEKYGQKKSYVKKETYGKSYKKNYDKYDDDEDEENSYGKKKEMSYGTNKYRMNNEDDEKMDDDDDKDYKKPYEGRRSYGRGRKEDRVTEEINIKEKIIVKERPRNYYGERNEAYGRKNNDKYDEDDNEDDDDNDYKKPYGGRRSYGLDRKGEREIEEIKVDETIIFKERPRKYYGERRERYGRKNYERRDNYDRDDEDDEYDENRDDDKEYMGRRKERYGRNRYDNEMMERKRGEYGSGYFRRGERAENYKSY